jgi:hypothetical protein
MENVTGRDGYLIAQALHEAIKSLSALPEHERPVSNIADMRELLRTRFGRLAEHFLAQDDLKAAMAELPPGLGAEETRARMQEMMDQWNERWAGRQAR